MTGALGVAAGIVIVIVVGYLIWLWVTTRKYGSMSTADKSVPWLDKYGELQQ